MASLEHEAPLAILREKPALLFTLLEKSGKETCFEAHEVSLGSEDLTQVLPAHAHVDLLVIDRQNQKPVRVLLFEVQLDYDKEKHFSWVLYTAAAHHKYRCDTSLVVFAPDPTIALWTKRPIQSFQEGSFAPEVLSREDIPYVDTVEEARRDPALAAFSAVVHGPNFFTGPVVSKAAWEAAESLPSFQKEAYRDLIYFTARRAAQKWMEALMDPQTQERIIKAAQERIFLEGKAEGKLEGKAEGEAKALLLVLKKRKIELGEEEKQRILACRDLTVLEQWLDRALFASTAQELFVPSPKSSRKKAPKT